MLFPDMKIDFFLQFIQVLFFKKRSPLDIKISQNCLSFVIVLNENISYSSGYVTWWEFLWLSFTAMLR